MKNPILKTKKETERIKITVAKNGNVYVKCPYDEFFVKEAKRLKGIWRPNFRVWCFPGEREDDVRSLVNETFINLIQ